MLNTDVPRPSDIHRVSAVRLSTVQPIGQGEVAMPPVSLAVVSAGKTIKIPFLPNKPVFGRGRIKPEATARDARAYLIRIIKPAKIVRHFV